MKSWFVYLLECKDGSYYTGTTNNVDARMKAHARGGGSRYVFSRGFKCLLAAKKSRNRSEALQFEYKIKQLPKKKKLEWFEKDV